MPEREPSQKTRDEQHAKRMAWYTFEGIKWSIAGTFGVGAAYLLRNGEFAAGIISLLAVIGDIAAFEIKHGFYKEAQAKKEAEIVRQEKEAEKILRQNDPLQIPTPKIITPVITSKPDINQPYKYN